MGLAYHPEYNLREMLYLTEKKKRDLHAGRLDISAETAQGIPKFDRAPLMIPHGKYRCMLVASAALFSGVTAEES